MIEKPQGIVEPPLDELLGEGDIAELNAMELVVQVGMGGSFPDFPLMLLIAKELNLLGSFRFVAEFALAVAWLADGVIDPLPLLSAEFASGQLAQVQLVF